MVGLPLERSNLEPIEVYWPTNRFRLDIFHRQKNRRYVSTMKLQGMNPFLSYGVDFQRIDQGASRLGKARSSKSFENPARYHELHSPSYALRATNPQALSFSPSFLLFHACWKHEDARKQQVGDVYKSLAYTTSKTKIWISIY